MSMVSIGTEVLTLVHLHTSGLLPPPRCTLSVFRGVSWAINSLQTPIMSSEIGIDRITRFLAVAPRSRTLRQAGHQEAEEERRFDVCPFRNFKLAEGWGRPMNTRQWARTSARTRFRAHELVTLQSHWPPGIRGAPRRRTDPNGRTGRPSRHTAD